MATKFAAYDYSGNTLYAILFQDANVFTGTSGGSWSDGSYSGYAISMTESGTGGRFTGTFPAVAAGFYTLLVLRRDGASVAITDTKLFEKEVFWTGTALLDYPANFASLAIDSSGRITVGALADGIITSAKFTVSTITGVATGILEKLDQLWRRFFKKATLTGGQIRTYADNGTTVLTTQVASDASTTETQGAAT